MWAVFSYYHTKKYQKFCWSTGYGLHVSNECSACDPPCMNVWQGGRKFSFSGHFGKEEKFPNMKPVRCLCTYRNYGFMKLSISIWEKSYSEENANKICVRFFKIISDVQKFILFVEKCWQMWKLLESNAFKWKGPWRKLFQSSLFVATVEWWLIGVWNHQNYCFLLTMTNETLWFDVSNINYQDLQW